MKIENKKFKGIEYTLVDIYDFNEIEKIYHFLNEENDIFCYRENNKYIIINDEEKINYIKQEFGLKIPDILYSRDILDRFIDSKINKIKNIYKLSPEKEQEIKSEVFEKLQELPERDDIDWNLIKARISKVELFAGEWNTLIGGFFRPSSNYIMYKNKDIVKNTLEGEKTKLHELIHAAGGRKFSFKMPNYLCGLHEGATENIVDRLYSDKRSVDIDFIRYNNLCRNCKYSEQVCIIRQMEAALGKTSAKSILEGNMEFFNEFSREYGKDLLRVVGHRSTRMISNIKNFEKYFEDTQNALITRVFDRDFEKIKSEEDVGIYFEKINKFGLLRGRESGKKDIFFEQFYNEKLKAVEKILIKKHISTDILKKYEYKEPEFYPYHSEEEIINKCKDEIPQMAMTELLMKNAEEIESNKESYLSDWKAYMAFIPQYGKESGVVLLTHNNELYSVRKFRERMAGSISRPQDDIKTILNDEGQNEYYIKIDNDELIKLEELDLDTKSEDFRESIETKIDELIEQKKSREDRLKKQPIEKKNIFKNIIEQYKKLSIKITDIRNSSSIISISAKGKENEILEEK